MTDNSTIAAIATATGGAIGMLRLSGPDARGVICRAFRPADSSKDPMTMPGYTGCFGHIFDTQGVVDEAVLFIYAAPASYTGEDCAELCCHGGAFVLEKALAALIAAGAVPAGRGEFTRRALMAGKLSLTEAESVADIIASDSRQSLRAALSAKEGALYRRISGVTESLLDLSAHLAAWIDYPEEDVDEVRMAEMEHALSAAQSSLTALISGYDRGRLLREGIATAIVGAVNVGKSTLMNLLAGSQLSIVTDIPGTTRDVVRESIRLGDTLLNLSDTAGLRDTSDTVEKIGVRRSLDTLERCDLILAVFDGSRPLSDKDRELLELLSGRLAIGIINKTDLEPRLGEDGAAAIRRHTCEVVELSAATGEGELALSDAVRRVTGLEGLDPAAPMLANARQLACAVAAVKSISEAMEAIAFGQTPDAVSVCVEEAIDSLLELTGKRAGAEIIDRVFENFCVGK